jgi:immunity protein Imm6 of predicted polymorphic toxin system
VNKMADVLAHATIRGRVAFVLAAAERVASGKHAKTALAALADAWQWVEGKQISASDIYENVDALFAADSDATSDAREAAAVRAAVSAFYYAAWHAFRREWTTNNRLAIPSDIADVTEEVIDEVSTFALESGAFDEAALSRLAAHIFAKAGEGSHQDDLGAPIARATILREYGP